LLPPFLLLFCLRLFPLKIAHVNPFLDWCNIHEVFPDESAPVVFNHEDCYTLINSDISFGIPLPIFVKSIFKSIAAVEFAMLVSIHALECLK